MLSALLFPHSTITHLTMTSLCLIFQSYTFIIMSRIFSLPHERAFQGILMRFIFVINVRNKQRAPGTTGIQTKAPYDKTHRVYLVADMAMLCGRYGLWPKWLWPKWFVAAFLLATYRVMSYSTCDKNGGHFQDGRHRCLVIR